MGCEKLRKGICERNDNVEKEQNVGGVQKISANEINAYDSCASEFQDKGQKLAFKGNCVFGISFSFH